MTTVASGRWTSAPVPVAIAIGIKPSDATSAVISTGRSRPSAPSRIASSTALTLLVLPLLYKISGVSSGNRTRDQQ